MLNSMVNRQYAWRKVVEAYQTCHQKYAVLMTRFELTSSQFDVMLGIESLGEAAAPKQIAEGLLVTKSNITSVTRRLLERGLIEQTANSEDKRSIIFRLTPSGTALLQEAKTCAKQFVEAQLAPFTEHEVELVEQLMQRMTNHLQSESFQESLSTIIGADAPESNHA